MASRFVYWLVLLARFTGSVLRLCPMLSLIKKCALR
jgi:hypothetical protein